MTNMHVYVLMRMHMHTQTQAEVPPRDWSYLGFQRGDSPQSDLRGAGMLGLACLEYYAVNHSQLVASLVSARKCMRDCILA